MPSGAFGKYIKTVLGLVILVTLAYPALKITDFDALLEKYTFESGAADEEYEAVFDTEKIVRDEFKQKLCTAIQDDIGEKFSVKCAVSADLTDDMHAKIYLSCDDNDFEKISGYISQKYALECAKNEKTGY